MVNLDDIKPGDGVGLIRPKSGSESSAFAWHDDTWGGCNFFKIRHFVILEFLFHCRGMRMWKLENLLFSLCMALSCVSGAAGFIHLSGYQGQEVNISCSYGGGYESYEKYLCKNGCGHSDVLVTTTEPKKSKYSIHDDRSKRVFTTTISGLSGTDAGQYWCGVTRNGKDIYTEVKLEVGEDTCCDQSTRVQSYEESSVSFSCLYDSKHEKSLKYFCRGNRTSTCLQQAVITTDSQQKGTFRFTDDKRSRNFTVTIVNLTLNHSGSYLCGVQHTGLDVFSAFELDVKEWCCVKSNKLSGTVGQPVTLHCPYPPQHVNNRKFLCKGDHRNNCTDMGRSSSRFTPQENASSHSFSVQIAELKADDAGTYWCGSDFRWSVGNYTRIQLSVVHPQQTNSVISTIIESEPVGSQPTQSTHINGKHVKEPTVFRFVVFIVPTVLLILAFALVMVIVYKYKCHKKPAAAVIMSTNKRAEEASGAADIYANQDVVVFSKKGTPKLQSSFDHYDDTGEDSEYQNFDTSQDIYCNQVNTKGKR